MFFVEIGEMVLAKEAKYAPLNMLCLGSIRYDLCCSSIMM